MPNHFLEAHIESREDFCRFVQKPLERVLGGRVVQTEGTDETGLLLDCRAGIDALLLHPDYGVFGIALRIQYDKNYETFTVRKKRESYHKTEFDKNKLAHMQHGITPKFTVQAYIDRANQKLLGGAVALTEDLILCIENGLCETRHTGRDQIGQASFYAIDWRTLEKNPIRKMWCELLKPSETIFTKDNHDEFSRGGDSTC